MASFMEELESSGLLKEDTEAAEASVTAGAASGDTAIADSASVSTPAHVKAADAAPDSGSAPTSSKSVAVTNDQALYGAMDLELRPGGEVLPESETVAAQHVPETSEPVDPEEAAEAEEGGEGAEQRVLEDVEGAPGWSEVMDMSSRKVPYPSYSLIPIHTIR